jgi:sugar lactone lactonase YvrE
VVEVPVAGGTATTLPYTFNVPSFLAFDASGNLYVSNSGDVFPPESGQAGRRTISLVTPGGVISTYVTLETAALAYGVPLGLTVDSAGNLYVLSQGTNLTFLPIYKISP